MVNTNIQAVIPFEGSGLTARLDGAYKSGEFSAARNVELVDGSLRTRRGVRPPLGPGQTAYYTTPNTYPIGFVGHSNSDVLMSDGQKQVWLFGSPNLVQANSTAAWAPTSLPGYVAGNPDSSSNPGHRIIGTFRYAGVIYWVTHRVTSTQHSVWVYKGMTTQQSTMPTDVYNVYTWNRSPGIQGNIQFDMIKVFEHKDRIFIVSKQRIWFSKATDPTVWTTPDGGFLDFEDGNILDAVVLGDSLYIATSTGAYQYTFNMDPNQDGYMRKIFTGSITGLCVSRDQVYAGDRSNLYKVFSSGFEPILNIANTCPSPTKMVSFGDTIIMAASEYNTYNEANIYMYNVTNGFLSELRIEDAYDLPAGGKWGGPYPVRGVIIDYYVAPNVEGYGGVCYFLVRYMMSSDRTTWRSQIYYMSETRDSAGKYTGVGNDLAVQAYSLSGCDVVIDSQNNNYATRKIPIQVKLRLENWSPDGSEFFVKKIKTVLIEGSMPQNGPGVKSDMNFYVDSDTVASQKRTFDMSDPAKFGKVGENRVKPFPYRFGLNQRTKALTIEYDNTSDNPQVIAQADNATNLFLEINRIMAIWSYTSNYGNNAVP